MKISAKNKVKVEGGMASMTDLVFLLLIFFIIMSLMSNNSNPVELPETEENVAPMMDRVEPTVVVTENGDYVLMPGGSLEKPMSLDEIKGPAVTMVKKSGKMKLKIAGHRKTNMSSVYRILALCMVNSIDPVLSYNK